MADTPDFDKFMSDPKYQGQRDLFDKFFEHKLDQKRKEYKEKSGNEDEGGFFDWLFK